MVVVLIAATTCNHDQPLVPFCPVVYGVGVIEGRVIVAGEPVAVNVRARTLEGPPWVSAETRSDSAGWYQLELPWGSYRLELPSNYAYSSYRDTVSLEGERRRIDILRGTLVVHVNFPPLAEGRSSHCWLYPVSVGGSNAHTGVVVADGQAEFTFSGILPDVYYVSIGFENGGPIWLPGTPNTSEADRVTVGSDRVTTHTGTLDQCTSIRGTVRGSWQEALQSTPHVKAVGAAGSLGETVVERDGSFSLDLMMAQPLKLQVTIGDVAQWVGGTSVGDATVFTPEPGGVLEGVTWTEGGILCQLEGPGPRLNHRARILLRDTTGQTYETYGESNAIAFSNLNPGRYWLYLYSYCNYYYGESEPWASQWYDNADSLEAATPVDVAEGQLVRITLHLEEGARIEGRVLTADGGPALGTGVIIAGPEGIPACQYWSPTNAGSFSFTGLGNGDYYIAVRISSGSWWYPGTINIQEAVPIRIRNHTTISGIEWRLPGN